MAIKYPDVNVQIDDGNAFAILSRVKAALRRHGVSSEEQNIFIKEATSGDYMELLETVQRWVTVL